MAFDPQQIQKQEQDKLQQAKINEQQRIIQEHQQVESVKESVAEEKAFRRGEISIRDIIAPAAFEVKPNFLKLGEKFVRTVFVVNYPRYISVGWFAPIINLNDTFDVAMFFYPVPSHIILKQLKKKVGNLEAQIISDAEKGAARDPLRETALRDAEALRDALTQGTEKFFQFALYVTIYADTEDELSKLTETIENIFGSRLIYSKKVFYQAEQGFNSTLPMNNDELAITFNMNTSPAASSFPFISSDLSSDGGILYGINRHNNSLILFDRFSLQNANSVVFATSGAGKSYAVKLEVLRSLMMGTDVVIIDPEKEYKHLCDAVGGTYINISLASENKINPFDLPHSIGDNSRPEDIIRSAVISAKGLIRIMLGDDISNADDSLIDKALLETYAKKDITGDADLSKVEAPILADFQDILSGMEGGGDIALRLKKYIEGTFSGLLNSPTTVEMRNQLVCFSVRDLEDELRPIAIYTIVNYIWNVVRSEMKKRVLVIDEAWWLMQHEDSAKFIFALVKRCRKYYLGVTTITQDVNDFLVSPYGQAIVNNSALQLLMRQSPAAIDLIQKTFILTEGEKYLLLESGVGEGIFFAGNKHAAIKIVASYTEDQLITTDPRQLLEIAEAKREFEEQMQQEESVQNAEPSENLNEEEQLSDKQTL
ncbi:conjugal transfer protein TraC [Candidatus Falkowbacteria bacterium CG10_big_fil_rev_8_21_14_0_10_37_6]|uniref:Conjugal transfer protein TraC n=1 Tax=Candidatus Falkowbacteria bacterium CG10_big_fil_rev_8_21_14_0_10_37_6 TaxID=1974563 RepID=A0A2H0V7Q7_9BACT|nr:MAG: conjugal transfer protein TraC [Candidatus Falkowbacteria bacterium CG10_big_fil_rev_8_21_14_0_10_37_6]